MRSAAVMSSVLVLVFVGACSTAAQDAERAETAAVLVERFDPSWLPAEAELWEALTEGDRCGLDCPPVAVSYAYLCTCADLDAAMAEVQAGLDSSGFETVVAYEPGSGFLEAKIAETRLDSGAVWVRVNASADAREFPPLDTDLAAQAVGRASIIVSLVSEDLSAP